jgi:hypothetical protein
MARSLPQVKKSKSRRLSTKNEKVRFFMTAHREKHPTLKINRAPVLTLWAAVVAQRLRFAWKEALTLGRAVAGLNAYAKGKALGLFTPTAKMITEQRHAFRGEQTLPVDLLHRAVPVRHTAEGLRALSSGKPINPASVQRYLDEKFGTLPEVHQAMMGLAKAKKPAALAREAYDLYEQFRPAVPTGTKGWGAAGTLHFDAIRKLKQRSSA